VDMAADAVQGFSAPFAADSLESWAFAAPPGHPLLIRWKQIFGEAIRIGFRAFKSSVPGYIKNHTIYGHMPYLTIHACYLMAAQETGMRAALTPSCNGPLRYLCDRDFNSRRAMKALMHEPLVDPPPLIKLRGAETNVARSITCKRGSFMSSVECFKQLRSQRAVRWRNTYVGLRPVARCQVCWMMHATSGARGNPAKRDAVLDHAAHTAYHSSRYQEEMWTLCFTFEPAFVPTNDDVGYTGEVQSLQDGGSCSCCRHCA